MADKKPQHAFDYGGEAVTFTANHEFYVASLDRRYETARQAMDAMDRAKAAREKVSRKALNLPVVDQNGAKRVITGIHAGHGHKITKPPMASSYSSELYPDAPVVLALLEKRAALQKEIDAVRSDLLDLRLESDPYAGRGVDLESRYEEVEKDYAKKAKRAEQKAK